MSRRGRAVLFAIAAALCAVASASLASAYRDGVGEQLGELRSVVIATDPLPPGRRIRPRVADRALQLREVPERFVPVDALGDPTEAVGRIPAAGIPEGSYLVGSQFRLPRAGRERERLPDRLRPVEVTVSGAGALHAASPEGLVDVVVAEEPGPRHGGRVRILARAVRLLALGEPGPEAVADPGIGTTATLAVTRAQALELIEAENFAREVRLIPSGSERSGG